MRFVSGKSRQGKPLCLDRLAPEIEKICLSHGLLLLYLHGSYASGTAGRLSDIDFAALGEEVLSWS